MKKRKAKKKRTRLGDAFFLTNPQNAGPADLLWMLSGLGAGFYWGQVGEDLLKKMNKKEKDIQLYLTGLSLLTAGIGFFTKSNFLFTLGGGIAIGSLWKMNKAQADESGTMTWDTFMDEVLPDNQYMSPAIPEEAYQVAEQGGQWFGF